MKTYKENKTYDGWMDISMLDRVSLEIHNFWDEKPHDTHILAIGLCLGATYDLDYKETKIEDICYECASNIYIRSLYPDQINYNEKGLVWLFWIDLNELKEKIEDEIELSHLQGFATRLALRNIIKKQEKEIESLKKINNLLNEEIGGTND